MMIREAEAHDLNGIVECYCSDVEKWHGFRNGKVIELSYEKLTPYERCHFNCGEWLDRDICRLHLQLLEEKSEKAFVAEFEGKIVGEAEVCLAEEPMQYGKYAFLTALMVHKDFRRRGIGLALVQRTIQWAKEKDYIAYDTIPEDEKSEGLYKKAGLKTMQELYKMRADIGSLKWEPVKASLKELSVKDDPSRELLMVTRHISPSIHVWRSAFHTNFLLKFEGYEGRVRPPIAVQASVKGFEGVVFLVPAIYNPANCFLHIYVKPELARRRKVIESLVSLGLELVQQNHFQTVETTVQRHTLSSFHKMGFSQTQHKENYMRLNLQ